NEQIMAAQQLLSQAQRPVLYVGGGVQIAHATQVVRQFHQHNPMPAVSTLKGLGTIERHHPYYLGMLGMHGTRAANLVVQECDLLLVVGARFDDRVTGKLDTFAPHAKVIHLDIDAAEINKLRQANVALRGEVQAVLPQLELGSDITEWLEHCQQLRTKFKWRYDHPGERIYAPALLKNLSDKMAENTVIATDVGQHQMWAAQHIQPRSPENFLSSAGLGTMGFGLPAAIGAQIARPHDDVVLITGDGSFMMNVQELGTIKRKQLPVKIILLNNQRLGMVRQWQSLFFDGRYSETILDDNPDFVALAKAFAIDGQTISRKEDIEGALETLLQSKGPYLLEVVISEQDNVWPLVPPGAANQDMLENT
ncbi:acetolactate synthase large subunit, partial [Photobacterium damselae subsp. damselae]|nr:acetolactate synthase large subunit [Photobacterium damselae subsp. damselae]